MAGLRSSTLSRVGRVALVAILLVTLMPGGAAAKRHTTEGLTPIVLFPAWHFTRLTVTVKNQHTDASCPASGTFEDLVFGDPGTTFGQVCRDELTTLRYENKPGKPMRLRFSEQPGVTVTITDFGKTESAPAYEPMFEALEAAGYTRNQDIRVAGYDARLTPDMGGFLQRSKHLIEQTYRATATGRSTWSAIRTGPSTSSTCSRTRARPGRTSTSTASRRSPATSPARASAMP